MASSPLKIVVVGGARSGKTQLCATFKDVILPVRSNANKEVEKLEGYIPTIGVDFANKLVNVEGTAVNVQVWDTAGQERFRSLITPFFRQSKAYILTVNLSESLPAQTEELHKALEEHWSGPSLGVLVGTFADLEEERKVTRDEADSLASFLGIPYVELSCMDGAACGALFESLILSCTFDRNLSEVLSGYEDFFPSRGVPQENLGRVVTILGDFGIGKTHILDAILGDEFDEDPADHDVESQISGEGLSEITWWDIPGPPLDSPVVYSDIPAASVFLVVYDITSPTSVGRIREHVEAVHKHHRRRGYKLILVGSKVDSVSEYGRADVEGVIERMTRQERCIVGTMETSAKEDFNIHELQNLVEEFLPPPQDA